MTFLGHSDQFLNNPLDNAIVRTPNANRIVHIGFGQFVRAHLAFYTQLANESEGEPWHMTAVNLNSATVKKQLAAQNHLYTILSKSSEDADLKLISVVDQALCLSGGADGGDGSDAHDDRTKLRSVLLSSQTKIVSLTVTEKGYYQVSPGQLDLTARDVRFDLENLDQSKSALGWIVWSIRERRVLGLQPLTYLSLDNLNSNGDVLAAVVQQFATKLDKDLSQYIASEVRFPNSMVDRIVPAVTNEQRDEVETLLGMRDEACVVTEVFSQWALEDKFVGERPAWQKTGVQMCSDVVPFEQMKLRLLNGAHSAIAYLGSLLGQETVSDFMAEPLCRRLIEKLMREEIKPEVLAPAGVDLDEYIESLLQRFSNPHLHHKLHQIAMDGSQKIPQRWIPVLAQRKHRAAPVSLLTFCVATWIVFVSKPVDLQDPVSEKLKQLASSPHSRRTQALLQECGVFPAELLDSSLINTVDEQVISIESRGIKQTLEELIG